MRYIQNPKQTSCTAQANTEEEGPKKKKHHSSLGHLWKTLKQDLMSPKAAAADLQVGLMPGWAYRSCLIAAARIIRKHCVWECYFFEKPLYSTHSQSA